MLRMDQVHVIRHKVLVEGHGIRRAAAELGVCRNTIRPGGVSPNRRNFRQVRSRVATTASRSMRWPPSREVERQELRSLPLIEIRQAVQGILLGGR
jgi:hypothetical protein